MCGPRKVRTVETKVYKTFAKIFGIILVLIGVGALVGAMFASSFISSQMEEQAIIFPEEEAIQSQVEIGRITEEDAAALRPYAGQQLADGAGAQVYADNYIHSHMAFAARQAGVEGETYATLGGLVGQETAALTEKLTADNPGESEETIAKMVAAEIANPLTEYPEAARAKELQDLRTDIMLTGNTLRGMLLNVYGWGLIGQIAFFAGIGAVIVGLALTIWGFLPAKKKNPVNA
ncbi:MAG: hypothetical protein Q4D87_01240 [Actinomycetaceae bacterium]|nr:hypothetical protein [Actinomycetaceae bacterium]